MGNYLVIGWRVCLVKGRQHKECKSSCKESLHPCFPHCETSEQEWAPAEGERSFIAQLSAAGQTGKLSIHQPLLFTSVSLWSHLQHWISKTREWRINSTTSWGVRRKCCRIPNKRIIIYSTRRALLVHIRTGVEL